MMSPLDSKILDINSERLGVSVDELMCNAGSALADVIADCYDGKKILFVCGTGNNGGDGFAAADILGKKANVAYFSEPKTDAAKRQFSKMKKRPIIYEPSLLKSYDVIVDCVLGTGISGKVRSPYLEYIAALNGSGKTVVSCDVPSGFGTSTMVKPNITVTFHDMKTGMTEENSGNIIIADIGIPKDAYEIIGPGDMLRYPIPKDDAHKGDNGSLLIIGGGPYVGAPMFAGMAALRIGADLVHIATPNSSFGPISTNPSFIVHKLPGDHLDTSSTNKLLALSENADCVLIGPGLGKDPDTKKTVIDFINKCSKPMVIDADGINAVAGEKLENKAPLLFTPHSMELKRLACGDAIDTAKKMNSVVIQKGKTDIITDGVRVRNNITGTTGMTVGGTGDALSGAIAGLIAKGMSPFDAGCLGTYICGKAGERSFDEYSYGMTASDLIDNIARVLKSELRG